MVEIKYSGDELWARIERAVEIVKERLRRVTRALNDAEVAYAVIGGKCRATLVSSILSQIDFEF